jgi:exoribonuclease R
MPPRKARQKNSSNNNNKNATSAAPDVYPAHLAADACLAQYCATKLVRGKLRVLPFGATGDAASFVACDRGLIHKDVLIPGCLQRNRAMHGDIVYVELIADDNDDQEKHNVADVTQGLEETHLDESWKDEIRETWQDDTVQMELWNPTNSIPRKVKTGKLVRTTDAPIEQPQQRGRVVHICPPVSIASELDPAAPPSIRNRPIVGTLKWLRSGTILLTPNNKTLPQFKCPPDAHCLFQPNEKNRDNVLVKAEYKHGSWKEHHNWPPCTNVERMGEAFNLQDEIQALLTEFNVNHGEFPAQALEQVDQAVQSGFYLNDKNEMGWKPTVDMHNGRRDYRSERIFTIDPTTAKDLDDALHVKLLDDGRVEIGVHIADVSFFVKPGGAVDQEAQRRSTTVYLVDRSVPMLPRPLCEIACSLNEGVERLAFSCVWRMNLDGTMRSKHTNAHGKAKDDVWYGRTVIRSCARLDYATAQNIIENKVATGEAVEKVDVALWPKSRQPTGGHTIDQVAADVRLMHKVAMARRKLRFDNGALALNGTKLTFTLDVDGETPLLAEPYPIRDSNRLVEEFMLIANCKCNFPRLFANRNIHFSRFF